MKLKSYREDLLKELQDPEFAAEYLNQALAQDDTKTFLIALKDVADASGGLGELSGKVPLARQSLYKVLSSSGNPTLSTLQQILRQFGLRVAVTAT